MPDYHHTVILNATPFGDFTNWCHPEHSLGMADIHDVRRKILMDYVTKRFGTLNKFTSDLDRSYPHLHAAVNGKKPFGEKLAQKLERQVKAKGWGPIGLLATIEAPDATATAGPPERPASSLTQLEIELLEAFRLLAAKRRAAIVKDLAMEALRKAPKARPRPPNSEQTAKEHPRHRAV